ncbi:universal stress protein [Actinophytocola sp. NPDC049390]|uniref:universal stress protein n=1 Tax=Actinophytocola sp. NPDC049390 TaxID=3363894 RepID=UPI00379D0795
MGEQIVVGIDGSASAVHATRWAAREAARRNAVLRLVHIRHWPLLLPAEDMYAEELTAKGREWLATARAAAQAVAPDVYVVTDLGSGHPARELVEETEHAALVVVGSRGLGGFRSLLLGSVANVLATHAHCPVVVLRARTPEAPPPSDGPVVVGVDGGGTGTEAVEFAAAAAAAREVPLVVVHAWTYEGLLTAGRVPAGIDWDEIAAARRRSFDEELAALRERFTGIEVRGSLVRGRPVDGILEQAEHAQLVVVGAHGRRRLVPGAVGATAHAVLHHATCPVAVVGERRKP